jgi:hypothetical protein
MDIFMQTHFTGVLLKVVFSLSAPIQISLGDVLLDARPLISFKHWCMWQTFVIASRLHPAWLLPIFFVSLDLFFRFD